MNNANRRGLLFVVSAPSGAGKTSLVQALLNDDSTLHASVSHTTRPKRPGEQNGVNYHFVDADAFQAMVKAHAFLEHALVFGHQYGTAKASVEQMLAQGQDLILEIDWQGARQVRALFPDCCSIFILPPSRHTLAERLEARGQDAPEVIAERTAQAREEMANHGDFDYLVVNDDFASALADLRHIVAATRLASHPQQQVLASLLNELLGD